MSARKSRDFCENEQAWASAGRSQPAALVAMMEFRHSCDVVSFAGSLFAV